MVLILAELRKEARFKLPPLVVRGKLFPFVYIGETNG